MSARSWLRLAIALAIALVFQVAVLDQVVIFGVHADVMVLFPAAAGLLAGPQRGAVVGFAAGLVSDLAVTLPFGLSALAFTLIGFAAGLLLQSSGGHERTFAQVGACVAAAAVGTAIYALGARVVHQAGVLPHVALAAVVVVSVGALILAVPVLAAMRWVLAASMTASLVPSSGSAA